MTLGTVAHQTPQSMEFFKQEYWSGLLVPPLGDLPNSEIKVVPLVSPALAGCVPGKPIFNIYLNVIVYKNAK